VQHDKSDNTQNTDKRISQTSQIISNSKYLWTTRLTDDLHSLADYVRN